MTAIEELLKEISSDPKATVLLIRELTESVSYYQRMLRQLELDPLTGLPGTGKFNEQKVKLAKQGSSVGAIMFDVNDLKYYNDNKGHQAGDLLLQKAAESFHAICTGNVRVYRTGGDEFMGLIANCLEADIDGVVAKWQNKLAELNAAKDEIRCTVAWGAAWGASGDNIEEIIEVADGRMYAEKRRMKESGEKIGDLR